MTAGLNAKDITAFTLSGSNLDTVTVNEKTLNADALVNGTLTDFKHRSSPILLASDGAGLPTPVTDVLADLDLRVPLSVDKRFEITPTGNLLPHMCA